jgi:hypothetical protein
MRRVYLLIDTEIKTTVFDFMVRGSVLSDGAEN